jgi:signal transduction histidine kinase/ligand-binding sensor domain-containing protein
MSNLPQHAGRSHFSRLLLLLFVILSIYSSGHGSDRVQFKTWNTENGLPQNTVNNIVQTPDGYLWLGTFDGLARFDGARFKIFKKSNTPALPMNRILSLFVDSDGRLWIWTEDPNTLVVYEQGKFRAFVKGIDFNADYIYNALRVAGGLRFRSANDDYVYSQGKFERRPEEQIQLPRVSYDLNLRLVWINTNDGYYAVNDRESKFFSKDAELPLDRQKANAVEFAEVDGGLWFLFPISVQDNRLCVFRNGQLTTSSVSIRNPKFFSADRNGNLWLGDFYDGIRRIPATSVRHDDPLHLKVERFSKANGLASNNPSTMLADKDGNIWIGTDKGLQLLIDEPLVTVFSKASGLPSENIYSIVQDKAGAIWFGAWDNYLVKYSNNVFTPEQKLFVQALFVDRESRLWVGASGGIFYRDNKTSQWSSLYDQLKTPEPERLMVTVISQDRNGDIWFGGSQGIARFHSGQIKTFRVTDGLPDSEVTAFLQTSQGQIWVGTKVGLAQLVDEKFVPLKSQNEVLRTFVRSLHEDHDGTLWIGTYDSGLFRYNNGRLTNINSAHGLFSDGAFCILEDDTGWFWMNSNQGIYRVRRDELNQFAENQLARVNSISYGPDDGLLNVEGNGGKQPAGLKASDGTLWFATAGGVAMIDPKKAIRNSGTVPSLIEDIRVDQNDVEHQSGVIRLEPGQATVEIAYTAMSFVGPDRVRFRYRLEGLDPNWTDAGSRRVAYFSHLPYGEYTFRVIAANADGVWDTSGATIRLVVLTPFYRRAWFYALVIVGVLSVLAALYIYRLRQLQAINVARADFTRRLIDSQENERRRIALELHDSLGQSLAVIRNRALMSLNRPAEHERMLDQMREISDASAAALQEAREIAHNLHPGQIEHLGLPAALTTLVESVQGGTSIQFDKRIENLRGSISRDEAINIYRIAQESLSNLIRHSNASQAVIALYEQNGDLRFSVEDNGRGIPVSKPDGGLGLKGIRERAQIINADLQISSSGKGTRITLSLPRVNHGPKNTNSNR